MENSIIPTAAKIRCDYMGGFEFQKSIAETIISAAKQGKDTIIINLPENQAYFITPILRELNYTVLGSPVRDNDNEIVCWSLEISW